MNREKIESTFPRLVAEGRQGFTLDLDGNEFRPDEGYAVATKTYQSLAEVMNNIGPHRHIGFWIDTETKKECFETVNYFRNKLDAFVCGISYDQRYVFDFSQSEEVTTGKLGQQL